MLLLLVVVVGLLVGLNLPYLRSIVSYSWMPKYRVAYTGNGGVPMAVPVSCSQLVSPKVKKLCFMIISRAVMIALFIGVVGRNRWMTERAWSVSMLVYIETASAVKRRAPAGRSGRAFRRSVSSNELLR